MMRVSIEGNKFLNRNSNYKYKWVASIELRVIFDFNKLVWVNGSQVVIRSL